MYTAASSMPDKTFSIIAWTMSGEHLSPIGSLDIVLAK
jgi:hypothetical protein